MKRNILSLIILFFLCTLLACQMPQESVDQKLKTKKIIRIMSPYTQSNSDTMTESFCKAVEDAQAAFPDYTIVHNAINTETYKNKLKINMAANETTDIFFSWTNGFLEPFVEKGLILPLNDYIKDIETPLEDERFSAFTFDDKVYGMAMSYWYAILFCNTDLFEQYHLELPETWEELLNVCRVFYENDTEAFASGLRDIWPGHMVACQLMLQLLGADNYNKMACGEIPFQYEEMELVGDYLSQLVKTGAFSNESFKKGNDDAAVEFFSGNAAMFFNGSCHSNSAENAKVHGKIKAIPFPVVQECRFPKDYIGKASSGLCVSASTRYPRKATEVAMYLAKQTALYQGSLTMWETSDKEVLSEVEEQILSIAEEAEGWGNNYDVLLPSEKVSDFLNAVIKIYKQESNGRIFASEVKRLFE